MARDLRQRQPQAAQEHSRSRRMVASSWPSRASEGCARLGLCSCGSKARSRAKWRRRRRTQAIERIQQAGCLRILFLPGKWTLNGGGPASPPKSRSSSGATLRSKHRHFRQCGVHFPMAPGIRVYSLAPGHIIDALGNHRPIAARTAFLGRSRHHPPGGASDRALVDLQHAPAA